MYQVGDIGHALTFELGEAGDPRLAVLFCMPSIGAHSGSRWRRLRVYTSESSRNARVVFVLYCNLSGLWRLLSMVPLFSTYLHASDRQIDHPQIDHAQIITCRSEVPCRVCLVLVQPRKHVLLQIIVQTDHPAS